MVEHDNRAERARREFYSLNRRDSVWEPFLWQQYLGPSQVPVAVEAAEYRLRAKHTPDEFRDRWEKGLPKLARELRDLKKGLRERDLDAVLRCHHKLRSTVTQVRVAESVVWPGRPLMPDWKQYSRSIRDDDQVQYAEVGRALETLAWGQALDDHLEVRRLGEQPLDSGPRLRDWGRRFAAQRLSSRRQKQERRAVDRLRLTVLPRDLRYRGRHDAPPGQAVSDADETISLQTRALHTRALAHRDQVYRALSSPTGCLACLFPEWTLRRAVYRLRVDLQALGCAADVLPARRSQFFLAGGDTPDNRKAWVRHLDTWWQCSTAQLPFDTHHVIEAAPPAQTQPRFY